MSNAAKQSKPFVRESRPGDLLHIAHFMRRADRAECWAASRSEPYQALLLGSLSGPVKIVDDGRGFPVAIFGVTEASPGVGHPWMLATDGLRKIRKPFLRECREHLEEMHKKYPILTNLVWAKNTVHIKWLEWMGFCIEPPAPHGPDGELFHIFHRKQYV